MTAKKPVWLGLVRTASVLFVGLVLGGVLVGLVLARQGGRGTFEFVLGCLAGASFVALLAVGLTYVLRTERVRLFVPAGKVLAGEAFARVIGRRIQEESPEELDQALDNFASGFSAIASFTVALTVAGSLLGSGALLASVLVGLLQTDRLTEQNQLIQIQVEAEEARLRHDLAMRSVDLAYDRLARAVRGEASHPELLAAIRSIPETMLMAVDGALRSPNLEGEPTKPKPPEYPNFFRTRIALDALLRSDVGRLLNDEEYPNVAHIRETTNALLDTIHRLGPVGDSSMPSLWELSDPLGQKAGLDLKAASTREHPVATKEQKRGRVLDLRHVDKGLAGANLPFAVLPEANLAGLDLSEIVLQGASLEGANFDGADLSYANLEGASCATARFHQATLLRTDLLGVDLREAHFEGAILQLADMLGGILTDAKFQGAQLKDCRLGAAMLNRTNLSGAYVSGLRLQGAELDTDLVPASVARAMAKRSGSGRWKAVEDLLSVPGAVLRNIVATEAFKAFRFSPGPALDARLANSGLSFEALFFVSEADAWESLQRIAGGPADGLELESASFVAPGDRSLENNVALQSAFEESDSDGFTAACIDHQSRDHLARLGVTSEACEACEHFEQRKQLGRFPFLDRPAPR